MGKVNRQEILDVLKGYDKEDITIATLGSHTFPTHTKRGKRRRFQDRCGL